MKIYFATQRYFIWSNPGLGDLVKIIGVIVAPNAEAALAMIPTSAILAEDWNPYDPEVKEIGELPNQGGPAFVETHVEMRW